MDFTKLASKDEITTTQKSLLKNGINSRLAKNDKEAIEIVLSLIPKGSEVMTVSSTTLMQLSLDAKLNESGSYDSVKSKLSKLDRKKDSLQMQKMGAAPEFVIGSVHAVTQDGKIIIASATGSQLPAYSYGSSNVIWVVSTKKIVKDLEEGMRRLNEYVLPLEDQRMKSVYGPEATSVVRKLLIINEEANKARINLIFVAKDLGF